MLMMKRIYIYIYILYIDIILIAALIELQDMEGSLFVTLAFRTLKRVEAFHFGLQPMREQRWWVRVYTF